MSAITGMIDWRGGPAGPAVRAALSALQQHGRDGEGIWDGGDAALGWRQTILQAQDYADRQPLTGGGGRFKLVFDGRLDNREELAGLLALGPEAARACPDSAYVLAAFEKWGEACPQRLLGDFAFAVWDGVTRELFLARDHMGMQPLVYFCGTHFFVFATHPYALFTHPGVPRNISDETIVRQLMLRHFEPDRIFFDGIKRLPSGHILHVTAAALRTQAYWRVEDTPDIRFPHDGDYVEAFQERFSKAVRCRLRTIHPVGSHLSSGWDSSSVTSVAAGLLAEEGQRLRAYTSVPRRDWVPVYEAPGQISDEGPLAAAVAARHANIDHVLVEGPGIWDFAAHDLYGQSFAGPAVTCHNAGWYNLLHVIARAQGVRVMLTGRAGNFTISHEGCQILASLLCQGKPVEFLREWRAAHALGRSHKSLLRQSLLPLLPKEAGNALLAAVGRQAFASVELTMLSAARLPQAKAIERAGTKRQRPTRQVVLQHLCRLGQERSTGYHLAAWDIDARDPTTDKRIAAYCYAIPDEQFFHHGQARRLLRRAMTGVLPDVILEQKGRGRQAADWCEAAVRAKDKLLEEIDLQAASSRLATVFNFEKIRTTLGSMSPASIAADPQIAPSYSHALLAVTVGRFVRLAFEPGTRAWPSLPA
jgi:asparagine synthase (glutamine-hydrolysing)